MKAENRIKRQLLLPGKEETIPINNSYWGCRKMGEGQQANCFCRDVEDTRLAIELW